MSESIIGITTTPQELTQAGLLGKVKERFRSGFKKDSSSIETKLDSRFKDLLEKAEHVPYNQGAGVVLRVNDDRLPEPLMRPLSTGITEQERVRNCNVVVIWGKERTALLHITPLTLPEDYWYVDAANNVIPSENNRHVDKKIEEGLNRVGTLESIQILTGDLTLAQALKSYLLGQENLWNDNQTMIAKPIKLKFITQIDLGENSRKKVVSDPDRKSLLVKNMDTTKVTEYYSKIGERTT